MTTIKITNLPLDDKTDILVEDNMIPVCGDELLQIKGGLPNPITGLRALAGAVWDAMCNWGVYGY